MALLLLLFSLQQHNPHVTLLLEKQRALKIKQLISTLNTGAVARQRERPSPAPFSPSQTIKTEMIQTIAVGFSTKDSVTGVDYYEVHFMEELLTH